MTARVRVTRGIAGRTPFPWCVWCDHCGLIPGVLPVAGSAEWSIAVAFARAHADIHLDKKCPTWGVVPTGRVSAEDTKALMRARGLVVL